MPSRFRCSCGSSSITTSRSPGTPPAGASLPMPLMLSCMPSSTPAGILISTTRSSRFRPCSSPPVPRLLTVCPMPPQAGQVLTVCIWPRKVLCTRATWPLPPQVAQVPYSAPSARTSLFTLIFFSTPLAISARSSFNRTRRLLPFTTRRPRERPKPPPPPKPPKAPPKASPKMSPNWLKMSSMDMPPPKPPGPPMPGPACPKRSYLAFFSGSLRIS